MAIAAALSLIGTGLQTAGALREQQNQKDLAKFHKKESQNQSRASANIFNIRFPQIQQQFRAARGVQATQIAKGGVSVDQGSPLQQMSEQVRLDTLNLSLEQYQQNLEQAALKNDRVLTNEAQKQIKRNMVFTLAAGLTGGATTSAQLGAKIPTSFRNTSADLAPRRPQQATQLRR
jgi:hypothetical protein